MKDENMDKNSVDICQLNIDKDQQVNIVRQNLPVQNKIKINNYTFNKNQENHSSEEDLNENPSKKGIMKLNIDLEVVENDNAESS
jgi:hypothetical protein